MPNEETWFLRATIENVWEYLAAKVLRSGLGQLRAYRRGLRGCLELSSSTTQTAQCARPLHRRTTCASPAMLSAPAARPPPSGRTHRCKPAGRIAHERSVRSEPPRRARRWRDHSLQLRENVLAKMRSDLGSRDPIGKRARCRCWSGSAPAWSRTFATPRC